MDRVYLIRRQVLTSEKKTSTFVLCFIGELSIKTRNVFSYKDRLPDDLVSCVLYKFQCGRSSASCYGKTDRHFKVMSGEPISICPFTLKIVKPSSESSIRDHHPFCNHAPSFDDFTILKLKKAY